LYNGALDGLSLTGDRFFYGNPLASRGQHQRREWFGTACCPANIARLVASLGSYIYAKSAEGLWVNLYVGSQTRQLIGKNDVSLSVKTEYPWNGKVQVNVDPVKKGKFKLYLRVPGWAKAQPVPGDAYRANFSVIQSLMPVTINGKDVSYDMENGYMVINREWKKGDVVNFEFNMNTYLISSRQEIKQNEGRVAIGRGPLVYCVEGADNNGKAWNIVVPENTSFETITSKVQDESVVEVKATVPVLDVSADGSSVSTVKKEIIAIPYYTWANRGKNEMQVWLPTKIKDIKINY
jgi:DUF1680 family protein